MGKSLGNQRIRDASQSKYEVCGEKKYIFSDICDVVNITTAEVLASYGEDYYAGKPALTKNKFGEGTAYYLCARTEEAFYQEFYKKLAEELEVERALDCELPENVTAGLRKGDGYDIAILQNYGETAQTVELKHPVTDMETGDTLTKITLEKYQVRFLVK